MSFFSKAKKGMADAAAATKRETVRLKLKADISSKNRAIKDVKEKMGIQVFDAMAQDDLAGAQTAFATCRDKINEHEGVIAAKQAEIEALDDGKEAADPSEASEEAAPELPTKPTKPPPSSQPTKPPPGAAAAAIASGNPTLDDAKQAAEFYKDNKEDVDKAAKFANEHQDEMIAAGKFAAKNKDSLAKGAKLAGKFM